ncbi:ribonuclease P protein component [Candidatus Woesebacteria bacterium]|nr:ribonuclease P protein component [Candidatus Woesebacteria bacterium]
MIPRELRLPLRRSPGFFSSSERKENKNVLIFLREGATSLGAVIVPKRIENSAVKRNSLKRKLKSVLVQILQRNLNIQMVVIAKKKTAVLTKNELFSTLNELV